MKKEKVANSNLNKQYPVGVACYATQNRPPYVGADALKSAQNAITLVALVVTVIILLILAGVTINLTIGHNGIFKTAEQAAKNYTGAQNKELAELNEFENTLNKEIRNLKYHPSLLKLKPGDYVKYDTGVKDVGDNGVVIFRVLYDTTSEYGLQIISDKNIQNVELKGTSGYNNAIDILNTAAMEYINNTYASDARCVGSNPQNKNLEERGPVKLQFDTIVSEAYNMKEEDTNYIEDMEAMKKSGILKATNYYWLASRNVLPGPTHCAFRIRAIYQWSESLHGGYLCGVYTEGREYMDRTEWNWGLRPCIILKTDINVTSGDGSSASTAYTLGI